MTTVISGLHSCKPGNEPEEGEVKTFILETRTSKKGKPWTKIKSAGAEFGGTPYRIVKAEQTDFVDSHGNLSFNLEIEAVNTPAPRQDAPQPLFRTLSGDDRSSRIERQHSQEMALRFFEIAGKLPTTKELREMTSFFQRDISHPPDKEQEAEPEPEYSEGEVPF